MVPTPKGAFFACRFVRDAEVATISTEPGTSMSINKAHTLLGHGNEEWTRQAAKALGWVITREKMKPCTHCATSKAKQKNVSKESEAKKATKPGGRIYLDLSKVTVRKDDGTEFELNKKNWKTMVDEATGKKWCDFTETKSGMVERTYEFMHKMKAWGKAVEKVRLDPVGEM